MDEELKKQDDPKTEIEDSIVTPTGREIYDKGERIVDKMNREKAVFDRDLFFQELYENYLICLDRGAPRQKPKSQIILRWDMSTSFGDFCGDSIEHIDQQIDSIKYAKAVNAHRISATEGDFFLSEAKIDEGSAAIKKKFGIEDYDAVYEILRRSREVLVDYIAGRIEMIFNKNTGRTRIVTPKG